MSYTSRASNALSQETVLSSTDSNGNIISAHVESEISVFVQNLYSDHDVARTNTISIGRTSDSAHEFERTVSITLDDEDVGTCCSGQLQLLHPSSLIPACIIIITLHVLLLIIVLPCN
jgi:hypothetical protein